MTSRSKPHAYDDDLNFHAEKLSDLITRLLAIGNHLQQQGPPEIEAVKARLEKEFGPEVWQRLYEAIPNGEKDEPSEGRSKQTGAEISDQ